LFWRYDWFESNQITNICHSSAFGCKNTSLIISQILID
jgi:hypothetical protein